jgi:hypothetical protein
LYNLEEATQMEFWSKNVRLGLISPLNSRQFIMAVMLLNVGVLLLAAPFTMLALTVGSLKLGKRPVESFLYIHIV